jgi:hypothetical protein
MNQISTLKVAVEEGTTDDLQYGRHAATLIKDPGEYHGNHRLEEVIRAA